MSGLKFEGNAKLRTSVRGLSRWCTLCGVLAILVFAAGCDPILDILRDIFGAPCTTNADCDDAAWCTGAETCDPDNADAGNDGCVAATTTPCLVGETCDEDNDVCFTACTSSDDCDDGTFCNGDETCVAGACEDATAPCTAGELCDEANDRCAACLTNDDCADDELFCTGTESCDTALGDCVSSGDPCDPVTEVCDEGDDECDTVCTSDAGCDDDLFCTDNACTDDVCVTTNHDCDDSLFCTGTETCNEDTDACDSAGDPCGSGTVCDEDNDECDAVTTCTVDADCTDDLVFCNGTESCVALVCTSSGDPCTGAFEECNEDTDACDPVVTPGANVVLTTAIDIGPAGVTNGDDTVTGTYDGGPTSTINLGDQVDAMLGNDTFNVISSASPIPGIDVTNTENIHVRSTTAATTWDVANVVGATHMVFNNGSSDLTLNKIQNLVTLGVNGGNGVEDFHGQFKDTIVNTGADALNVDLNGADLAIFDVEGVTATEGFEDITFDVTGDNEISELTSGDNDLKNVFIKGGSTLVLGNTTAVANATKFDANGFTGDLDVSVSAGNTTCIGGAGNDRFNFAATLGPGDSIDGNGGENTLAISQSVTAAGALASAVAGALNIQVLEVTHAASVVDMDFVGTISKIVASGASSTVNIDSAINTDLVKVVTSKTTLDIDEETDTLSNVANVELNGKAAVALSVALDATDHETVNITSEGIDGNSVANVIKNSGGTINVTGSKDLTISAVGSSAIVNAATFGGKLNVTGSGAVDDITGSAQDDVITGAGGSDTLTGGTGANTFSMLVADVPNTITDYVPGVDFFDWNTALLSIDTVTTAPSDVNAFQSAGAGTAIAAPTGIFELTGATVATQTAANVVTALGTTATNASIAIGDKLLFVIYTNGGGAAIWEFTGAGANVTAGELTLAATLNSVAADSLSAVDFP